MEISIAGLQVYQAKAKIVQHNHLWVTVDVAHRSTQEPLRLILSKILKDPTDAEEVRSATKELLVTMLQHEVEEFLRINGERVDPHT